MNKKTLVLGASPNPARFAWTAVARLVERGEEVIPIGIRKGNVSGVKIQHGTPAILGIHTVSLYLRPALQKAYYSYLLSLTPKRIIFNPGTENAELMRLAREAGIQTVVACTLVMLSTDSY